MLERDLHVLFKAAPAPWVALAPRDVLFIEAPEFDCVWLVAVAALLIEFCVEEDCVGDFDWFSVPIIVWLYGTVVLFTT